MGLIDALVLCLYPKDGHDEKTRIILDEAWRKVTSRRDELLEQLKDK